MAVPCVADLQLIHRNHRKLFFYHDKIVIIFIIYKTLIPRHLRHTSPTKGPCYRTSAVPSRSAGVSVVAVGGWPWRGRSHKGPLRLFRVVLPRGCPPMITTTVPNSSADFQR
jgi:hypothetical protein